ncbi:MAG: hypothetical protein PHN69_03535 [Candidatus Pacebacteria bacterium]|nr:hypothetical protein [Fermentimonas sp.]MDD4804222.1 hypothetical protein [Candidatus Paceibacterota bacterium]
MSTRFRTIAIVCMVLVLMSAPCLAACPYSTTGKTASSSTDDGSCSSCGKTSCTGNTCSTSQSASYSPYSSGEFKCTDGTCAGKYCVNGKCDTTEVTDSSAGNASGAVVCKDGTCEAKVCNGNGTCKTGSFSTSGDTSTISSWLSKIFGGNSVVETGSQEVATPSTTAQTTTTPSNSGNTYAITGSSTPKTTSTNYFGTFAMSGSGDSNQTSVVTTTPTTTTTTVPAVTACTNGTTCSNGSCKINSECSQCAEATTPVATPVVSTTTTTSSEGNSTCAAYDKVYAALKADKTENNVLSNSYTSLNFAQDVCSAMKAQGVDCKIVKVTFTDGSVNYLNAFDTCNGKLLVDSCGTAQGTGIKKQVTVLEVGQQWTAKSLFGECTKTYTRGTVSSIE